MLCEVQLLQHILWEGSWIKTQVMLHRFYILSCLLTQPGLLHYAGAFITGPLSSKSFFHQHIKAPLEFRTLQFKKSPVQQLTKMLFLPWTVSQAPQDELSLLVNKLLALVRLLLSVLSLRFLQPPVYLSKRGCCIVWPKFRHSLFCCVSFPFIADFFLTGAKEKARFHS